LFIGGSGLLPLAIQITPYVSVVSGAPFNITTGIDNNGDTLFADRPAFATPGAPGAVETPFGVFNPNPAPGDKIIPRNFGQGPGRFSVNFGISRSFGFGGLASAGTPSQRNNGGGGQAGAKRPQNIGTDPESAAAPPMPNAPRSRGPRHKFGLVVGVNATNLFNHTNFENFNGVLTSPMFGRASRALNGRRIDLTVKFNF